MDEDHFLITTFRLFDTEKDDVVEFLMRLTRYLQYDLFKRKIVNLLRRP
jgi:hypothetical protein